jgi:hypothetical protein
MNGSLVRDPAEQSIPGLRVVVVDVRDEVRADNQRATAIGGAVGEVGLLVSVRPEH